MVNFAPPPAMPPRMIPNSSGMDRTLAFHLSQLAEKNTSRSIDELCKSSWSLLALLNNAQNVTLLTSELLVAPGLWRRTAGQEPPLSLCSRMIRVFVAATGHRRRPDTQQPVGSPPGPVLSLPHFVAAVVLGLSERTTRHPRPDDSPPSRCKDLMALTGILLALHDASEESFALQRTSWVQNLQSRTVHYANWCLRQPDLEPTQWQPAVAMALTFGLSSLGPYAEGIDQDALLPIASRAMMGSQGLDGGSILGAIDTGVARQGSVFNWPSSSPSFVELQTFQKRDLIVNLGPLAKMLGESIKRCRTTDALVPVLDDLLALSQSVQDHWRRNKLSTMEISSEEAHLTADTLKTTWPVLWNFLRRVLYGTISVLQEVVARCIIHPQQRAHQLWGPMVATKTLHILRNLFFIASQKGVNAFESYQFVQMAALDTITLHPAACVDFLAVTKRIYQSMATDPLDLSMDLFYLQTAEHLPLYLTPDACNTLIVVPATPYLNPAGPISQRMTELFEAAHAAVLSVISCPANQALTADLVQFYIERLFAEFSAAPRHISPRQFRLAFKTMIQILSPPFPLSATHSELAEILMEMVRMRVPDAGAGDVVYHHDAPAEAPLSNQSTYVLAMIDALPFLLPVIVEEWLTITAVCVNEIMDARLREVVKQRFCDLMTNGEMDPQRATIALAWWGGKGGSWAVLAGTGPLLAHRHMMSGAIVDDKTDSTSAHL